MGKGSYQTTNPNDTPNAETTSLGARLRELSSMAEGERAQIVG